MFFGCKKRGGSLRLAGVKSWEWMSDDKDIQKAEEDFMGTQEEAATSHIPQGEEQDRQWDPRSWSFSSLQESA